MKRKTTLLLLLGLLLCCAFVGCSGNAGKTNIIVLDEEIQSSYEYTGEEIRLPSAHVENKSGEMVSYDVKYVLHPEQGDAIEKDFPSFALKVGKYRLEYVYGKIRTEKEFTVVDTTKPTLTFTGVTGGVFLQDMPGGMGQLPTTDITDLSEDEGMEIERKLTFRDSTGTEKDVTINEINLSYPVTEFGTFTYTVTATDKYDNSITDSISWRIKDRNWAPVGGVKTGYLADYDQEGYINYVEPGDVDQYYKTTDITEDWLETYEGASGVLKVTMGFNHAADYAGYNTVRLRLPASTSFTAEQAKGKMLAVRMYLEGDLHDQIIFGGNDVKIDPDNHGITNCSKFAKQGITTGEWVTVYYDLSAMKDTSGNETMYDETDDKCHAVQLCFKDDAAYKGTNEHMTMYVDGIALADRLGSADITVADGKATWTAVTGATSYVVEMNGAKQTVTATEVALSGATGYVKVTPRKDEMTVLDGDTAVVGYGLHTDGYLAKFDSEAYKGLIGRDIDAFHQYYSIEQELVSDGLRVKVLPSSLSGLGAGFSVTLGESLAARSSDYLVIRLKFDNEKFNFLYLHDGEDRLITKIALEEKSGEFFEIKVDVSDYEYEIDKLLFKFGDMTVTGGVTDGIEVVLGEIRALTYLATPQITDNYPTKTVSWTAVPNAAGYVVKVNGVEKPMITDPSYDYTDDNKGTLIVKAVGNGSNRLVDSDYSAEIAFDQRGYNVALGGFTYDSATKALGWTDIEHNDGYEVRIGNGAAQKVTANSFDCTGLENGAMLYVRGIGDETLRDTEWANVTVIDDALYEIKGNITLDAANIGWGNANVLQLNGLPLDLFEGDANAGSSAGVFGAVTFDGTATSVSASFFGNANKTFMVSGLTAQESGVLTLGADTVLYQNGVAYRITEDFSVAYFKEAWYEPAGEWTLRKTGWGNTSTLQLPDVELAFSGFSEGQTVVGIAGEDILLDGETIALTAKYYEGKTLQFDGAFAEGKVLVLPQGMILYNAGSKKAYTLGEDFSVVYAGDTWNVVRGTITFDQVGWGNNTLVQLPGVTCDQFEANETAENSTTNIAFFGAATINGTTVKPTVKYFNANEMMMFTASFNAGDVFMIGDGAVIYQKTSKTAYVVEQNMYMHYIGGAEAGSWEALPIESELMFGTPTSASTENAVAFAVTGLADGAVDMSLASVTGANGVVTVTANCADGVLTVSGSFGGSFVLKAGAVLKQGDKYYLVGDGVSILYQSGVWGAIAGNITIGAVGYTTDSVIQTNVTIGVSEGEFDATLLQATMNGEAYTFSTVKYHASGILEFQTVGRTPAAGDWLVVKAGSLFVRDGKFYRLESDFGAMLVPKTSGEGLEWKYAHMFSLGKVGYATSGLIQIGGANWALDGGEIVLNSATFVNFATKVECSAGVSVTEVHYHPSASIFQPHVGGVSNGTEATIIFRKGAALYYNGICYVLTEDYTCQWDGSAWAKA